MKVSKKEEKEMLNWYLQSGNDSDVVVSSRIRLARNISGLPFSSKCSKQEYLILLKKLQEITPSIGYGLKFIDLKDLDDITKLTFIEKHLVSPDLILDKQKEDISAMLINEDENICIMINEEDHLRIQVFSSGLELENLMNLAIEIDEKIGSILEYSYHEEYGFLTSCPTNVGTGLRVSVMLHLPALTVTQNIVKVLEAINSFGMNIRGLYGENSKAGGNMYQISNKKTLGLSEKEIVKNLKIATEKIIQQERAARKHLLRDSIWLEDEISRNYGTLKYCKKISSQETREILSDIKLGVDLGILEELTDLKVKKLDLYTKPASLQKYLEQTIDSHKRDIKRAEVIKKIINEEE